jgi:hypothetical protein
MEVVTMETSKVKSKLEKEALIQEFQASGMQKAAWCKEKGIPYPTFYKWIKSYEKAHEGVKFVEVTNNPKCTITKNDTQIITEPVTSVLLVEIGSYKLHITETTSISLLTKVMKVVNSLDV